MFWVGKQSLAPFDFSWMAVLATILAAIITAVIAANLTRRWFGKLISFLSAIVFGSIASFHFNSHIGACLGAIFGACVVFDLPRKCSLIVIRWFGRHGLWMFGLGGLSSFVFLSFFGDQNGSIQVALILGGLAFCLLIGTVNHYLKRPANELNLKRFVGATCSFSAAFILLVFGWVLGVETVNQSSYHQLRKTGGGVWYDLADASRWLTHGLTIGQYVEIGAQGTNESMRLLKNMPQMINLSIDSKTITDEGFRLIPKNPYLQRISIQNASLTDDAFKVLGASRSIYSLNLSRLPIGDDAIVHLGSKPSLNHLRLRGTKITDRSLKTIGNFSRLQYLTLRATEISDDGLAQLNLPSLATIDLAQTRIRGPGLAHLAKLPSLQWIDLSNTELEPEYLDLLASSRVLSGLVLDGIKIDAPAVDALIKLKPSRRLSICDSGISDKDAKRLPTTSTLIIDAQNLSPSTVQIITQRQNQLNLGGDLDLRLENKLLTPEWIERMSRFGVEVTCSNCTVDLAAVEALERHSDSIQLHFSLVRINDELYERLNKILGVVIGSRDAAWPAGTADTVAE